MLPSRSCEHVQYAISTRPGETQNYITVFIDQPMGSIDVLDGDPVCDAIRRNRARSRTGDEKGPTSTLGKHGKSSIVTSVWLWSCHDGADQGLSTMCDRDVVGQGGNRSEKTLRSRVNRPMTFNKIRQDCIHVSGVVVSKVELKVDVRLNADSIEWSINRQYRTCRNCRCTQQT
jgi:hypothetical protein